MEGLSHDEAMDEDTQVSVDKALQELGRHGFGCDFEVDGIFYTSPEGWEELIAKENDGQVFSADVMGWLGY